MKLLFCLPLLLLGGCSPKSSHYSGGFPAAPSCVNVVCKGTWMVKPQQGVYCKGQQVAEVSCYSATRGKTAK